MKVSDVQYAAHRNSVNGAGYADDEAILNKFKPLSLSDLITLPAKEWIIDQVIGKGDLGMIYGPPGSAKTLLIIDMIFSACLALKWAMRFSINRALNVAYCAGEGVSGLPARFGAAAEHYGVEDMQNFTFFATTPSLYYDKVRDDLESIDRFILEWEQRESAGQAQPLDLLFIDTFHSATSGADENSARDMGIVLNLCKKAAKTLGCAVILVHHSNKAGTGERGSSALRGAMDTMIETDISHTKFVMRCEKLKDGEKWREQTFCLVTRADSVRVWWDEPADGKQAQGQKQADRLYLLRTMADYNDTAFTVKALADVIGKSENYIRNLLVEMEKSGACKRTLSKPGEPASSRNPWLYHIATIEQYD